MNLALWGQILALEMKSLPLLALIVSVVLPTGDEIKPLKWTESRERELMANRNNPSTWDMELLRRDTADRTSSPGKPMVYGAFPVPKYELQGKNGFKGVGVRGNFTGEPVGGRTIVYAIYTVNRNAYTAKSVGDRKDEAFLAIATATDFVDMKDFTHAKAQVSSRNTPYYVCQGLFKTRESEVDYMGFLTPTREAYAVINMRLFNLKHGRLILIAPHTDGTMRSLQVNTPLLDGDGMDAAVRKTLHEAESVQFFSDSGVIPAAQPPN